MHRSSQHNPQSGFTLIEVVIGMAILTVVLATMFSALTQSLSTKERAKDLTFVYQAMQVEIMELQSLPWSDVQELDSRSLDLADTFTSVPLIDPTFRREVAITSPVSRTVSLSLTWEDSEGRTHNRSLETVLTKGGLYDYQSQAF